MKLGASIYQASPSAGGTVPSSVLDDDISTVWNTGTYSGYIILDLEETVAVDRVRLLPNMFPATGQVRQEISVSTDATSYLIVWNYEGPMTTDVWLEADLPTGTMARYIKVTTYDSISWVAWASIHPYSLQVMHTC